MNRLICLFSVIMVISGCATTGKRQIQAIPSHTKQEANSPEAMDYVLRAATAEASGDIWQAIALYRLAGDYDTSSSSILQSLAEVYLKVNEVSAARTAIDRAFELEPKNVRTMELRSSICFMQRDAVSLNNSLRLWSVYADSDSSQVGKIAGMYFMIGDHVRARNLYANAIKRFGSRENWLDKLSAIYIMEKNWKEAEKVMGQLAENDAGNIQRWLDAGESAMAAGDTNSAKQRIDRAISIDANDFRGWRMAILLASVTGDSIRADSLVDAGYKQNPQSPDLVGFKVTMLQRQKKYTEALNLLQQAITLDSNRLSFYIDLGFIAHTLERPVLAESAYVHALRIDSSAALVLNNYAYLLATQNRDLDRALTMVKDALRKEPKNASYLDTQGWIHYRLHNYQEAIDNLLKAAAIDTVNGEIQSHLGDVYSANGDFQSAVAAWKRALELDPSLIDVKRKLDTGKP